MRSEISAAQLREVLSRTLEEAAFIFAEATADPPELEPKLVTARLEYAGGREGSLLLVTGERLASTLAANMLGEDEGGADVAGDDADAVGELLNMIAGILAVELFGAAAPSALGLPTVRRVDAGEGDRALEAADTVVTLVEEAGRRVDLALSRGPGAPS